MVKDTTEIFITKATTIHGNTYDYSQVNYVKSSQKIIILCSKHGAFEQIAADHLKGCGCPKCSLIKRSKSLDTFIQESNNKHNNKYDYSKVVYKQSQSKVTIICPIHREFRQTPENHLRSSIACPNCTNSKGFNTLKAGILYYLSIDNGTAYKIGVTNKSIEERFTTSDLEHIKVIKIWEYPLGIDAYKIEQRILKEYKDLKYTGKSLLSSGNSELFSEDVLGLDVVS